MARFVLTPCKLREDRLTPIKGSEAETFTWKELVARLAPSAKAEALRALYYVQRGAFLGLLKHPITGAPVNFCFVAQDRSGDITGVIKRDPTFSSRLLEVYRVDEIDRGANLSEFEGTSNRPPTARR